MLTDRERLLRAVQQMVSRLESDPSAAVRVPAVSSTLKENLKNEVRFLQHDREFVFQSDELGFLGGDGTAPSPLRYFLSGVAFCQSVWYAKGAALAGCDLEALRIDVHAYLDVRGEHKVGEGVPPHLQWFVVDADVGSPSSSEAVLAMVDEADARCPVFTLLKLAIPAYERIVHNGTVIRDTVPAEAAEALEGFASSVPGHAAGPA